MASLKYIADSNLMKVTLASAYTAADGHMHLTSGHGARLPATGDFWLRTTSGTYCCFKCTARSTDDLTITPAQDGTSDGNLDTGAELKWVLGVTAFDQYRADVVQSGTYATLPAGEKIGQLYIPTDSAYSMLRYNGSVWQNFKSGRLMVPPVIGDYAWVNQGSATAVATYGGLYMTALAASGNSVKLLKKAAPATPYTFSALIEPNLMSVNYAGCGLCFRQAGDGKLVLFFIGYASGTWGLNCNKYTDATTYSASYNTNYIMPCGSSLWLRIADDGANRVCSTSYNGRDWFIFHTIGRTDFLTADEIGFYVESNNATNAAYGHFLSVE